ncbi:MAG: PQQ-binding-like beta-propeller repeat protein [Verrucomicrobiales bacterium]
MSAWCSVGVVSLLVLLSARAADQPQWGHAWTRNQISRETGLPDAFDPKTKKNVQWVAKLGSETHSTPVVAGGRVYIGTNNDEPRDPKHEGDRGVLMCFDEKSGALRWQLVVPKRDEDKFMDWPKSGISSPATVEGDRVYVVSNRGEVVCLDAHGAANGNDGPFLDEATHMTPRGQPVLPPGPLDADILWLLDLKESAGIWPHDAAHSSILIHGGHLYLNSGTGVDNTHRKIRTPDAPGLVVVDKKTGRLLARDAEKMAPNIFHSTWSSPSLGVVDSRPLVFFGGGNGVVYGFEALQTTRAGTSAEDAAPIPLKKAWKFDFDPHAPKHDVHRFTTNRQEGPSNIFGMPVFHDGRLYVTGGGDLWWGKTDAWLKCIDPSGHGDVTTTHEVWTALLQQHVLSTPAVYNRLVFVADTARVVYCFNADSGRELWRHETEGQIWASPLAADGKVFIGTRHGDFHVLAAEATKKVLGKIDFGVPISATAIAANGVLYLATMTELWALARQDTPR